MKIEKKEEYTPIHQFNKNLKKGKHPKKEHDDQKESEKEKKEKSQTLVNHEDKSFIDRYV